VERLGLGGLEDLDLIALLAAPATTSMMPGSGSPCSAPGDDGNPFFVAELLRHLAETGAIYRSSNPAGLAGDLGDLGLPQSVRTVIGHR